MLGKACNGRSQAKAVSAGAACASAERWLRLAHALQLSPVQREHLLTLRTRQLAKLARLTDARRTLSMQVGARAERQCTVAPTVENCCCSMLEYRPRARSTSDGCGSIDPCLQHSAAGSALQLQWPACFSNSGMRDSHSSERFVQAEPETCPGRRRWP